MKELSIEEKAKSYDESLERARDFMNGEVHYALKKGENIVCWIFPELRESEDERIRKDIISYIQVANQVIPQFQKDKWIAWLEKQGEQNLANSAKTCKDEQKPADKVEPKFKVGEWLVHKDLVGVICCITQIHAPHYYLTNKNSFIKFGEEDNYRPWTIQDAKDGDVLSYRDGQWIFIYKKQVDDNSFHYYSLYSTIHQDLTIDDSAFTLLIDGIVPATKEQREQLEKAMADAGYTFDFEKKELKKVEQTSADETPYPETLEKAIDLYYNSYGNGEGEFEHLSLEKFRDIVHTFVSDYGQKPAWSEKDEHYYGIIQYILNNECVGKTDKENAFNWFRYLKERVLPQSKLEWSEEDNRLLNDAISLADECDDSELRDWLKSLRPQNTWKPSDEQMEALRKAEATIGVNHVVLAGLISDLEKLKG